MALGQMRQVVTSDNDLNQLQSSLNEQFQALAALPFVAGVRLTSINLSSGTTKNVDHKLGRLALGYVVLSKSASATVWNGILTDTVVPLETSADCTVDLWVF